MTITPEKFSVIQKLKSEVLASIDKLAPTLIEVSQSLHANPELAFEEHDSVALLCAKSRAEGLDIEQPAFGLETAFRSDFGNLEGPCIAILSEYDALPNIGHACGHNIIAAIGLGTALALKQLGQQLPGRVRYMGTPAEERGAGKELMAQAGAFEGIDAAMMVHPAGVNLRAVRTLCLSEVKVTFHGKQAHAGAYPENGINALDALVLSYQAIGALRQHIRTNERVHGVFTKAGETPNVVPDQTSAWFFVRAGTASALKDLKPRVAACFQGGAKATGCTVELEWTQADYLNMLVNEPLAAAYESNARVIGVSEFTPYEAFATATTDMGNVSHRVPVLHPTIACAPPSVTIHDPDFANWAGSEKGNEAVIFGAKALALTAIDYLTDQNLRDQTAQAFHEIKQAPVTPVDESGKQPAMCGCC
ncbi:MAG: amidohydrolase [Alphaproteobacteria bacterium]|nr:MAG: amidohydrolase [Alphaproteobacteria bacterium]